MLCVWTLLAALVLCVDAAFDELAAADDDGGSVAEAAVDSAIGCLEVARELAVEAADCIAGALLAPILTVDDVD